MTVPAPDSPVWFKSSYSAGENDCVEIATEADPEIVSEITVVHIRDSKNTSGPTLSVPAPKWKRFTRFAATFEV